MPVRGRARLSCDPRDVRSEPLNDAASHLSELAEEVESTRGRLRLTRSGRASLVLLTEDEFASMQETIALAGDPVAQQVITEADSANAAGDFAAGDELRVRFGLPPRVGSAGGSSS
jgi:antitoxin YefM